MGHRRLQELLTVGGQVYFETHVAPLLRMQGEVREIQLELQCRDGRRLPVLLNTVQKVDEAGRAVLLRSTVFDITDRKRYEQELLKAKRVAEQRARHAALGLALSRTLTRRLDLGSQLRLGAEALAEHLDLAEVRIWGLEEGTTDGPRLWASAGIRTASGEPAPEVPPDRELRAAVERRPVILQGAALEAAAEGEEWLRREGVTVSASFPLLEGERLMGVLCAYVRGELDGPTELSLSTSANELSVGMARSRAEAEREGLVGRLQAQARALDESREWLATTLRSIGDAVIATDAETHITFLNPVAEALTGWRSEEAWGRPLREVFRILHETTRAEVPSPVERALRERTAVGLANHTVLVRRDGTEIAIDDSAAPIPGPGGGLGGAVLVFRDVSAQRDRERALHEARQRLGTVVRRAPIILFAVDLEGRILVSEGRVLEELGLDPDTRAGRSVFEEYKGVSWLVDAFARAIRGEVFSASGELQGRTFETHFTPTLDDLGRVSGTVGLALDVTERRRYEETIRKTVEFEQQLLGIVSHDLRNPISSILLSASLLLTRSDTLDEKTLRAVSRIRSSSERAQRLIRDLLDFTQARLGGRIPIERVPVDLSVLVPLVLEEVESGHPGRIVVLQEEGDLRGEWDGDRLSQVVTNLTVNALKYSPDGTPVTVSLRAHGDEVVLEVHNEGPPIPRELQGSLFLPMRRASTKVDAGRSVGLGLFIVKQLVQAHGGEVDLRSDEVSGTVFRVRLPRGGATAAREAPAVGLEGG